MSAPDPGHFDDPTVASIWIGTAGSREAFRSYIDWHYTDESESHCPFASDFGTGWVDHDFQEAEYFDKPHKRLSTLLNGFPGEEQFIAELVAPSWRRSA